VTDYLTDLDLDGLDGKYQQQRVMKEKAQTRVDVSLQCL
jgi:hypothetical protein